MKHILCAYDGSEQAEKAFELALDFAHKYKAALTVLAVARPPEPSEDIETEATLEAANQRYKHFFHQLKQKANKVHSALELHFKIAVGHPAEQIVHEAEQLAADHIVLGHRGQTIFNRWLLGSVAKQVMIYAHCAITVVR